MASFDTVNYSLRPNKAIQRQIVFDALELIDRVMPLRQSLYIGFGSVWFTDFVLAHRRLGIRDMISIENKPIGALRARFNAPFKTVKVEEGESNDVLRAIADDDALNRRQWVVWLDYDRALSPEVLLDIGTVVTHAPPNSVLILTVNASAGSHGDNPRKREAYVRNLLGPSVSDSLTAADFGADAIVETLAASLRSYIADQAVQLGRPGGFVEGFRIPYRDGSPMLTIGGFLCAPGARSGVRTAIADAHWPGMPRIPVAAPPLTMKEISALQRLLPSDRPITRAALRRAGFDLEDEQLSTFCEHYRRYPAFSQVVT